MWPQKWYASAFCARSASSTKPPPARPSSRRPVRARNPRRELAPATASLSTHGFQGGCQEGLELEERVERSLREDLAVAREHDSVRTAGDGERLPGFCIVLLVEELELDVGVVRDQAQRRLQCLAELAAGRGEDGERDRRATVEALDQRDASAELRAFVREREG